MSHLTSASWFKSHTCDQNLTEDDFCQQTRTGPEKKSLVIFSNDYLASFKIIYLK